MILALREEGGDTLLPELGRIIARRRGIDASHAELEVHRELRPFLARLGSPAAQFLGLIVDPALVSEQSREFEAQLQRLSARHPLPLVMLQRDPTRAAMHGIPRVARILPCDLVVWVREVCPLSEHSDGAPRDGCSERSAPDVVAWHTTRMSIPLRRVGAEVSKQPRAASVKQVAATLRISRRTLERRHRAAGAPNPAALLRELAGGRRETARARQRTHDR